jgi:hypothetical protein
MLNVQSEQPTRGSHLLRGLGGELTTVMKYLSNSMEQSPS